MQATDDTFPTIGQAVLLLLASFLMRYLMVLAFYDLRKVLGLGEHEITALSILLADGLLLATVLHFQRRSHRDLLHAAQSSVLATITLLVPPVLLLVPMIVAADGVLMSFLEYLFPLSLWEEQAFSRMVADHLGAMIATCILAPVLEEMLFRGVLLRSFLRQYPRWPAIAVSALLFGVAHFNIYQFVLAFWVGLLLGWLYERSRSLIPCIALHAALNTWVVFTSQGAEAQSSPDGDLSLMFWVGAAFAALLGAWLLRRMLVGSGPDAHKAVV